MPDDTTNPPYREINEAILQGRRPSAQSTPRRRRLPRQSVSWFGRYHLDDQSNWNDCEVIDISVIGVGVRIGGSSADDLANRRITIEVRAAAGASVSLRLVGEIRHAEPMPDGRVRVGVGFMGLSETERTILDALEHMGVVW
jgi:hypothetical protein